MFGKLIYFVLNFINFLLGIYILFGLVVLTIKYFIHKEIWDENSLLIGAMIVIYTVIFFILDKYINFGKHKGTKWSKLPDDYLHWLSANHSYKNIRKRARNILDERIKNYDIENTTPDYNNNSLEKKSKQFYKHRKHPATILGIIESQRICWKCNKHTPIIALRFYSNVSDVELKDGEPEVRIGVKYLDSNILKLIQSAYPFFGYRMSKAINETYLANSCIHCKALQGDFYLYQEIDSPFLDVDDMNANYFIVMSKGEILLSKVPYDY